MGLWWWLSTKYGSSIKKSGLAGTITDCGKLTHSYSVQSGKEVKMTKQEIIEMIQRAGFEAVERDTVYNRVEKVAA